MFREGRGEDMLHCLIIILLLFGLMASFIEAKASSANAIQSIEQKENYRVEVFMLVHDQFFLNNAAHQTK